jgi:hypothetical protein
LNKHGFWEPYIEKEVVRNDKFKVIDNFKIYVKGNPFYSSEEELF